MYECFLVNPGPRPPYYLVGRHLWGTQADWDSDGDSDTPDATDWTELTAALRPQLAARVDIDPIHDTGPLVLWVRSESADLTKNW